MKFVCLQLSKFYWCMLIQSVVTNISVSQVTSISIKNVSHRCILIWTTKGQMDENQGCRWGGGGGEGGTGGGGHRGHVSP